MKSNLAPLFALCSICLTAQPDHSVKFDGVDDYLQIFSSLNFSSMSSGVSVAAWIKDDFGVYDERFVEINHMIDITNRNRYTLDKTIEGNLRFFFEGTNINISFPQWALYSYDQSAIQNTWHHLLGTVGQNSVKLYFDGALVANQDFTGSVNHEMLPSIYKAIGVAANFTAFHSNAYIDEVAIWNVELSASEVAAVYNNCPSSVQNGNLVMYYKFNEGTGTTIADESGNNFSGSLVNGTAWSTDVPSVSCSLLPIKLSAFTVRPNNKAIEILWSTASEFESDYFEIEWSADAKYFSTLGKIKSAGTSNSRRQYNYLHTSPAKGINYYRLKEISTDGSHHFSEIEAVNFIEQESQVKVFPTLSTGTVFIENLHPDADHDRKITLTNLNGKLIQLNAAPVGQHPAQLDLSALPKGIYFLHIRTAHNTNSQKIILY